jgi:lysophospholipase
VPQAKGVLIISPGQTESSLKYAEVLYDLKDLGYSIYIIDHRGQGLSDRTLPGTTLSHVNRFKDYVDDFTTFVKDVVHPENYRHSVIIAHSMGGANA